MVDGFELEEFWIGENADVNGPILAAADDDDDVDAPVVGDA